MYLKYKQIPELRDLPDRERRSVVNAWMKNHTLEGFLCIVLAISACDFVTTWLEDHYELLREQSSLVALTVGVVFLLMLHLWQVARVAQSAKRLLYSRYTK